MNWFSSSVKSWLCGMIVLLSFFQMQAQTYVWENLPIGGGGFVSAIITSKTQKGLMYARTDVGGAYRWDASKETWIPLLDWVSSHQTGYLGVESLAIHPSQPNKVYMLAGISYFNGGRTAILKSEDYGATFKIVETTEQFKAHGNGMGRQTGEKLVVDPVNPDILYCGTRWNGLFKSTNGGMGWNKVVGLPVDKTPNENGISFVLLDSSNQKNGRSQTMFVGVSQKENNFYRSDNGGKDFKVIEGGPDLMPARAVLASDGNLFITYADGAGPHGHWSLPEPMKSGAIWKYNSKTNEWKNITPNGYSNCFGGISVDPNNPKRLIASTMNTWILQDQGHGDRIFLSNDGGENWNDLFSKGMDLDPNGITWVDGHAIHWTGSIEFDPFDSKKVWVTSGNGVFRTDNVDTSFTVWKFQVKGLEETVPLDMLSIPKGPLVSVIGDYDGFMHSDVTQYAPIHQPRMGTSTGIDYAFQNPDVMLRAGDKLYYTLDGGKSWMGCPMSKGKKGRVAVSADGKVFLHCPEKINTTYRSADRGTTWTQVKGLTGETKPTADPVNVSKFYAYTGNGKLMVSNDGGETFKVAGTTAANGSSIIRTVPGKEGHLWIALNDAGLSRSTDSGNSFDKIKGVLQCSAVGLGKEALGQSYPTLYIWGNVKGKIGLHRSVDEGKSWVKINDEAHEYGGPGNGQFVLGDWNVFGRVYMSTAGRGIIMGSEAFK